MFNLIICCNKRDHLLARCKLAGVFSQARKGMSQESQIRLTVCVDGAKRYHNNNYQLHREDGPAVIEANGTKMWYINGKRHRVDGAAIERETGYKQWFLNGERHRTDGPAIEYADGFKYWYLNDEYLTEADFLKHPLCTIK